MLRRDICLGIGQASAGRRRRANVTGAGAVRVPRKFTTREICRGEPERQQEAARDKWTGRRELAPRGRSCWKHASGMAAELAALAKKEYSKRARSPSPPSCRRRASSAMGKVPVEPKACLRRDGRMRGSSVPRSRSPSPARPDDLRLHTRECRRQVADSRKSWLRVLSPTGRGEEQRAGRGWSGAGGRGSHSWQFVAWEPLVAFARESGGRPGFRAVTTLRLMAHSHVSGQATRGPGHARIAVGGELWHLCCIEFARPPG